MMYLWAWKWSRRSPLDRGHFKAGLLLKYDEEAPMRILFDIIGQTFRTLWAHKLRSFLTMFGIAWGVGSLLLLVGLGEGFRSGNQKQLNTMGENIVWVNGGWVVPVEGSHNGTRQYWVNYQDVDDIRREATKVG